MGDGQSSANLELQVLGMVALLICCVLFTHLMEIKKVAASYH